MDFRLEDPTSQALASVAHLYLEHQIKAYKLAWLAKEDEKPDAQHALDTAEEKLVMAWNTADISKTGQFLLLTHYRKTATELQPVLATKNPHITTYHLADGTKTGGQRPAATVVQAEHMDAFTALEKAIASGEPLPQFEVVHTRKGGVKTQSHTFPDYLTLDPLLAAAVRQYSQSYNGRTPRIEWARQLIHSRFISLGASQQLADTALTRIEEAAARSR